VSTIQDVYDFYHKNFVTRNIFGSAEEWEKEYKRLSIILGKAIIKQAGVSTPEEASKIPKDTELGEEAQAAFDEIIKFVSDTDADVK